MASQLTSIPSTVSELVTAVADSIDEVQPVQSLWGGYGQILRCQTAVGPVIVKSVQWPTQASHPRGWATDRSHERKVRSYRIETHWYQRSPPRADCPWPRCLGATSDASGIALVLEDLDAIGFGGRRVDAGPADIRACLDWLAAFHAAHMGHPTDGLWPTGTYWHLATRPDELAAMEPGPLKDAAAEIDTILNNATHSTIVHGDAKLANFCFSASGAAAVDFQYVGGGPGIKDVAYFLSSCLDETEALATADDYLDHYFARLRDLRPDGHLIEAEWRALYPMAWADFYRFLAGWSPGHWKMHGYSKRMTDTALAEL